MRNRIEAGGADCPSVSSGLAVRGEPEIGGFLGGFSPAQQEATLARYRATLRLRPGSSRYRTNGKCWLSGHRSQRTPRYRSSRKGRSKRAQPEHGHALTSQSLALRAPSLTLGRARGWHRRVATLLIRSRRRVCAGEHQGTYQGHGSGRKDRRPNDEGHR